jgi:hypothetical protein
MRAVLLAVLAVCATGQDDFHNWVVSIDVTATAPYDTTNVEMDDVSSGARVACADAVERARRCAGTDGCCSVSLCETVYVDPVSKLGVFLNFDTVVVRAQLSDARGAPSPCTVGPDAGRAAAQLRGRYQRHASGRPVAAGGGGRQRQDRGARGRKRRSRAPARHACAHPSHRADACWTALGLQVAGYNGVQAWDLSGHVVKNVSASRADNVALDTVIDYVRAGVPHPTTSHRVTCAARVSVGTGAVRRRSSPRWSADASWAAS